MTHDHTRLYFYDLPQLIQFAVLSDIAYDQVGHIDRVMHSGKPVYVVTTHGKSELSYNHDGTHWNDKDFLDTIGWQ
jgi:hypothetical protein